MKMKTSGYIIIITAHYNDDSSFDLETHECKDILEVTGKLAMCKLEYKSALSKGLFKDEFIKINIRVLELNTYFIPKLVSSFELNNKSDWSGWSIN